MIVVLTATLASLMPALLAYSVSPSATFLNQAAAVIAWGLFLFAVLNASYGTLWSTNKHGIEGARGGWVLALAILILAIASSTLLGSLPISLALPPVLILVASLITGLSAVIVAATGRQVFTFQSLAFGMLVAAVLSVIVGWVQVFFPEWADGRWIAISALEGRATGNLRQPNHVGSLMTWGLVALVALGEIERVDQRLGRPDSSLDRGAKWLAGSPSHWVSLSPPAFFSWPIQWALAASLVFGIVLSGSRTSALELLTLAAWGLMDRRLSRHGRALLWATPLLYALIWMGLTAWAYATGHPFGGSTRFSMQGDISSSRFGIWANTLSLIAKQPWTGVGWGEFNFAWTLTPFPNRPVAFFDHTHNIVLQLLVELGVPLASLVLGLLAWSMWRAAAAAWRAEPGALSVALRSSWVMLSLVALHSQFEYPLWYAYFLLPSAFMLGLCLGKARPCLAEAPDAEVPVPRRGPPPWLLAGAAAMAIGGAGAVADYWRVVVIFAPPVGAPPLPERIEAGEHSLLFAHHAYYAAATTAAQPKDAPMDAFKVTSRHLLDTRLMMAWGQALNASGDVERARHLAARLREFRNPNSQAFFEPCDQPSVTKDKPAPFQCTPPTRAMDWRDFK